MARVLEGFVERRNMHATLTCVHGSPDGYKTVTLHVHMGVNSQHKYVS
jgi:hypothetical protein